METKKALDAYKKLENDVNKEFVVEALYFKALDNFDKNDYLNSNLVIEKISNNFSGFKMDWEKFVTYVKKLLSIRRCVSSYFYIRVCHREFWSNARYS